MEQRTKVFFTSDAHLGSAYHKDPRAVEQRLVRWLQTIQSEARAVYFLGDMFDYWFEYRAVVPRGYVRFLGQVAMMHDQGVEIHFFAGNHDVWFRDYLEEEVGAIIHHHAEVVELMGKTFRLAHGDEEYCVPTNSSTSSFVTVLPKCSMPQYILAGRWASHLVARFVAANEGWHEGHLGTSPTPTTTIISTWSRSYSYALPRSIAQSIPRSTITYSGIGIF